MHSTLLTHLNKACQQYASRPAFACLGHKITYAELDHAATAFASYLQHKAGLQHGDRIAVQLPNLLQYPVVALAALRAGLIIVNTNPLYTEREMAYQFKNAGAKALVVLANITAKVAGILDKTDIQTVIVTEVGDMLPPLKRLVVNTVVRLKGPAKDWANVPGAVAFRDVLKTTGPVVKDPTATPEDVAVLQYTGGTTGVAKGAMLTHHNLIAEEDLLHKAIKDILDDGNEVIVAPLPLYHIYAFVVGMVMPICRGWLSVLIPNPRDISGFVREVSNHRFTLFMGLNTLFNGLCRNKDFHKLDFSRLKLTLSGGMALTSDVAERWEKVTGCRIVEGYGLTETTAAITANPPEAIRLGTVGKALDSTEIKIIDDKGAPVPPGEQGELSVRGPQVMKGYWHNEQGTAEVLDEQGWFRTGDIAIQEEDGYFRIVDRVKDMIVVSGFKVYPNEVEEAMTRYPGVVECAAVGVPDNESGEAVKLFVVATDSGVTESELRTFAREQLTGYKQPKYIEFSESLPKTNVGKVLRRELRNGLN